MSQDILSAIHTWEKLAADVKEWAEHEHRAGIMKEPFGHRMNPATHQYAERIRTAESFRLELETGKAHCVCHLQPYAMT